LVLSLIDLEPRTFIGAGLFFIYFLAQGGAALVAAGAEAGAAVTLGATLPVKELNPLISLLAPYCASSLTVSLMLI
jgi:hypothetical protein